MYINPWWIYHFKIQRNKRKKKLGVKLVQGVVTFSQPKKKKKKKKKQQAKSIKKLNK